MKEPVVHPVPYQGSKRKLASTILSHFPLRTRTLFEPFAGSAAVSLAALQSKRVEKVHLNDALIPLISLWEGIAEVPTDIAAGYETLWTDQSENPKAFYKQIRTEFNHDQCPIKLLYLLARCVKSAVRFNAQGAFNQSADRRRLGTQPMRMRKKILGASRLLQGRLTTSTGDYEEILVQATPEDLVYLDPPYQGTSQGGDLRYVQQLDRDRFTRNLEELLTKNIPFVISFDGRCGAKRYGSELPPELGLTRLEVSAGRSSQATLNGQRAETVESLYLSPQLVLI